MVGDSRCGQSASINPLHTSYLQVAGFCMSRFNAADCPHRLSPTIELTSLRDIVPVGLLPTRKECQALARDVMVAGEIVHTTK